MPEITDTTPVTAAELDEWERMGAAWMTEQMHARLIAQMRRLHVETDRLRAALSRHGEE